MYRVAIGRTARIARKSLPQLNVPIPTIPLRELPFDAGALPDSFEPASIAFAQKLDSFFAKKYTPRAQQARRDLRIPEGHKAVLSIDGGGVRGLIPLVLVRRLEEKYKAPCYEIFDVILGSSTGAIIGGMIASGSTAEEIQTFYHDEIHRVFELARDGRPTEPDAV
jgi:hypothetical protein